MGAIKCAGARLSVYVADGRRRDNQGWADLLRLNICVRLIELIESWQANLGFADYLADPNHTGLVA